MLLVNTVALDHEREALLWVSGPVPVYTRALVLVRAASFDPWSTASAALFDLGDAGRATPHHIFVEFSHLRKTYVRYST